MQGGRGGRDPFFDPFASFGSFGSRRSSLMSPFFGGRDPFDDPFFTRPFGGMFESNFSDQFPMGNPFMGGPSGFLQPHFPQPQPQSQPQPQPQPQLHPSRSRGGPIIVELDSDNENEGDVDKEKKKDNPRKHGRSGKEPYVVDPDDEPEGRKSKQIQYSKEVNSVNHRSSRPQASTFSFQSSTVTYGGSNGAYYTSSTTKRTGSDGLTFEERKEADSTTGQASHLLSRGIHDKGHSVARKLKPDGTVDTMQALHNLHEEELAGFEEVWNGSAKKHLPGWTDGINMGHIENVQMGSQNRGGWALPSTERSNNTVSRQNSGRMRTADNVVGDGRAGSFKGNNRTTRTAGGTSKKMNNVHKH